MDKFDGYVAEKGELIDRLTELDNGFESLYEKVSQELSGGREKYAAQIKRLQALVTQVTDLSVAIQAQEARNKKLIEDYFRTARAGIRANRKTAKAAYDYYKNMSSSGVNQSRYMDSKH